MVHFTSSPLFQIRLENDSLIMSGSKTESVGCVLRGQLVLVVTEPTKFKEINLTFQGRSKVGWVDGVGKAQYHHSEERILFQHDWTFLPAKKQCHVLNPDNYHWDFELILPGTLPETIEGCYHGNVKYTLKATAERSTFAPNLHAQRKVTLLRSMLPSSIEFLQTSTIANTWTNKIEYDFSIGAKVFSLGDKFQVSVNLRSIEDDLKVQEILCVLKEYVTYTIGPHQKTDSKAITGVCENDLSRNVNSWCRILELQVPNDPTHCVYDSQNDTICVIHRLKFYVTLFNQKTNHTSELRASLPIIITLSNDSLNLPAYHENESDLLSDDDMFDDEYLRSLSSSSSASSTFSSPFSSPCSSFDESCEIKNMCRLPSYRSISSLIPVPLSDSLLPPTYDASISGH
ncbi:hypothetical protein C1645_766849 [Glomus cerebriforme]|uniref:Arrestin C-terminal-like domain-containing protein n=1 Tax=Glomus cerebriforme TaxID=658196 RepID=A0A397T0J2_9GLOM|nr:hypothetical protein C1645_766849 [Glomus cerebriforme]